MENPSKKLPPHSTEAEQALLGAVLVNNDLFDSIQSIVNETDFYHQDHRAIFVEIAYLLNNASIADCILVNNLLLEKKYTLQNEPLAYLESLVDIAQTSSSSVMAHAKLIREHAILRALSKTGSEIAFDAFNPEGRSSDVLLDEAERKILSIADISATHREGFQPIRPLMKEVFANLQAFANREDKTALLGLSSGFADLDNMTQGFQKGDLIIVAGRPSMGKTAFVLNVAEHVALVEKKVVAIFSLEMSATQLVFRLLSTNADIPASRLRTANIDEESTDWLSLSQSCSNFYEDKINRIFIDDTGGLTPSAMRSRARRLKREVKNLGLIIIDYIQLMQGNKQNDSRASEVSDISRSIKALARELNVPVIALSQLSRKVEERSDKRPVMSDLRESGAIEQDADLILMLYRGEYYNPGDTNLKGLAELIIGKQRNGPTGSIKLTFIGETMRFASFTSAEVPPNY